MTSTGTGWATSLTRSAWPLGMTSAKASSTISTIEGRHSLSASSVKYGWGSLRSAVCRGGSTSAGITGMDAPVAGIMIPEALVKSSKSRAAFETSS